MLVQDAKAGSSKLDGDLDSYFKHAKDKKATAGTDEAAAADGAAAEGAAAEGAAADTKADAPAADAAPAKVDASAT